MGTLLQVLEMILEMQRKMSNGKITRRDKISNLQSTFIFFSFPWTPPSFKPHNFLISYSFKMI